MLRSCIERLHRPEIEEVDASSAAFTGSTRELLEWLGLFCYRHCQADRLQPIMRVVDGELGNFPELAEIFRVRFYDPTIQIFAHIIDRGVAWGEFSCADCQPYVEFCFGALMHALDWNEGMGHVLDRQVDAERYVRIWAASIAFGLTADPVT